MTRREEWNFDGGLHRQERFNLVLNMARERIAEDAVVDPWLWEFAEQEGVATAERVGYVLRGRGIVLPQDMEKLETAFTTILFTFTSTWDYTRTVSPRALDTLVEETLGWQSSGKPNISLFADHFNLLASYLFLAKRPLAGRRFLEEMSPDEQLAYVRELLSRVLPETGPE